MQYLLETEKLMIIDKIISLANAKVRLQFLAMERSLRAVGCQLPILVIPYDEDIFELPKGSSWWEVPEITKWLESENAHPVMRKYQCLTVNNYQFVDSDICFLRNPEDVLRPHSGFITSCGHWQNPGHTYTAESQRWISQKTTLWQRNVFNSGQFACDRSLYSVDELQATAGNPDLIRTCIQFQHNEQPGMNLLVWKAGVEILNLTLPPVRMESTWAGDYPAEYEQYWQDPHRKPYLIHWAGNKPSDSSRRPIDQIFYSFLTLEETADWNEQVKQLRLKQHQQEHSFRAVARKVKHTVQTIFHA